MLKQLFTALILITLYSSSVYADDYKKKGAKEK